MNILSVETNKKLNYTVDYQCFSKKYSFYIID